MFWTNKRRAEFRQLVDETEIDEGEAITHARVLLEGWYKGIDLDYEGFDLGKLIRTRMTGHIFVASPVNMHAAVRDILKVNAAIDNIFKSSRPDRILYTSSGLDRVDRMFVDLVRARGADVRFLYTEKFLMKRYNKKTNPFGTTDIKHKLLKNMLSRVSREASTEGPTVVFLASVENNLPIFVPVMQELMKRNFSILLITSRDHKNWRNMELVPEEVETVVFKDLFGDVRNKRMGELIDEYAVKWEENVQTLKENINFMDVDLLKYFGFNMEYTFVVYLSVVAWTIEVSRLIYEKCDTKLFIISRMSSTREDPFVAVARSSGIHTLSLPHIQFPRKNSLGPFDCYGFPDFIDRICVWGEEDRENLLNFHAEEPYKENLIAVTGNTALDILAKREKPDKNSLRENINKKMGLGENLPIWVTYAAQGPAFSQLASLQRSLAEIPEALLLVKVHPAETPERYRNGVLPEMKDRVVIVPHNSPVDLVTLFEASDMAVTYSSTSQWEAMTCGTPLIVTDMDSKMRKFYPRLIFLEEYGILCARSEEEMESIIKRLAGDAEFRRQALENQSKVLERFIVNARDGKATERVMEEVRKLVGEFVVN